jgi:hypothetical protein
MPAIEGTWRAAAADCATKRWPIAQGLFASIVFALGLAIFLLVRRAMAALVEPLPPLALVATAVGLFAWMWAVRLIWSSRTDRGTVVSRRIDGIIAEWLPQLTLLLVAVACSYPGRRIVDWLVWLPAIVAISVGPQLIIRWRRHDAAPTAHGSSASPTINAIAPIDESGTLLQQLSRSRDADGREMVQGTMTAEFAPGERTAVLYVAFCPPFESLPQVEAEIADGPDASVKVAQVLHNGARFEVRLAQPTAEAATVSLEIVAHDSIS